MQSAGDKSSDNEMENKKNSIEGEKQREKEYNKAKLSTSITKTNHQIIFIHSIG